MKEVIAIIRRHNLQETKAGLLGIGIPALTMVSVEGRGKEKGIPGWNYELDPALPRVEERETGAGIRLIPKRMISTVVEDDDVPRVVETIIRTNQTGNIGDGKIFVCPVDDAMRVRTGESGEQAIK
ncbi:MAG TPA: P-II family nitrogen regulator [Candidatus Methanoperedenaceae archaeon]|nr:P-II family nitrogen regulator [Candidatus Methanoperedenaceae archaeon]